MVPRWKTFSGIRTAQGSFQVTVRNGPYVSTGGFAPTIEEALKLAGVKFEDELKPLISDNTDLSHLLSED